MNLHAAAVYAMHLLTARSTAGHGVHSPFMFSFITEVIGGGSDRAVMKEVESLRREMLSDRRLVRVRDLGAGSAVMSGAERRIRDIAVTAAVPKREAALLARIAGSLENIKEGGSGAGYRPGKQAGFGQQAGKITATDPIPAEAPDPGQQPGMITSTDPIPAEAPDPGQQPGADPAHDNQPVILELGTSLGISTLAMALGAPQRRVISVEGCPELADMARDNLRRHGAHNAEVICMEFGEALNELKRRGTRVALAYIDGNHRGAALTEYVHRIREMGEEMIIVADDIHMNGDMTGAWRCLTAPLPEKPAAAVSDAVAGSQKRGADPSAGHLYPDRGTDPSAGHPYPEPGPVPSAGNSCPEPCPDSSAGNPHPESGPRTNAQPGHGNSAPASLETFRMGMLFYREKLTPGRYRVLY